MHHLLRKKREKREKGCDASTASSQALGRVGTVAETGEDSSLLGLARQLHAALASRSVQHRVPEDDGVAVALEVFKAARVVDPRVIPRGLRCVRCCKAPTDPTDTRIHRSTHWLPARHDPSVMLCIRCHPTRDHDQITPFDELCPPVPCPRCSGPACCALGRWWCEACSPLAVDPLADQHAAVADVRLDAELFALAERAGFPRLPLSPGVTVLAGEDGWRRFAALTTSSSLRARALAALHGREPGEDDVEDDMEVFE
jgi:hypothetical protein